MSSTGGTLYITTFVNPTKAVAESNYHNDEDIGPPFDATPVLIEPPAPANLIGTTLAVTPTSSHMGQHHHGHGAGQQPGAGASPQTRALLSLTPTGLPYGQWTTVGIGNIIVPPLAPFQTINLVQTITLPDIEPAAIANYTNFGLTMTQDADYLTSDSYPQEPDQGLGFDQAAISITTSTTSTAVASPYYPDLAASSVLVSPSKLSWGSSFTATTDVENLGQAAAGSFRVRYLLTGQGGSLTNAIFLGDAMVNSLAPGATQEVTQTLQLPGRLPNGVTLSSVGYARIAVVVDPENVINETLYTNNQTLSVRSSCGCLETARPCRRPRRPVRCRRWNRLAAQSQAKRQASRPEP